LPPTRKADRLGGETMRERQSRRTLSLSDGLKPKDGDVMGFDLQYEVSRTVSELNGAFQRTSMPGRDALKTSVLEKSSEIDLRGQSLGRLQSNNCGGLQNHFITYIIIAGSTS
jgi:hypothetical protein